MATRIEIASTELPKVFDEVNWFAVYTKANHERRVAGQLSARGVEHFLPAYLSVRHWKDRRVTLEMPLFPGYVFVRIAPRDRLRVLQVPGVAHLVGVRGNPEPLLEAEVVSLRESLAVGVEATPHPYLIAGRRVTMRSGPLAGLSGILIRCKSTTRFVVSVELIQRSIAVELDAADLALAL